MNRSLSIAFTLLVGGVVAASSQSNVVIDLLLNENQATYGKTLYLTVLAGGLIPEVSSVKQALHVAQDEHWVVRDKEVDDQVTEAEFCYMVMKALRLKGGILYTLFPSPRYAFREMKFRKLISEAKSPGDVVSGVHVVQTLGEVLEWRAQNQ